MIGLIGDTHGMNVILKLLGLTYKCTAAHAVADPSLKTLSSHWDVNLILCIEVADGMRVRKLTLFPVRNTSYARVVSMAILVCCPTAF